MAGIESGTKIVLAVEDPALPGTFVAIGGMISNDIEIAVETADVTNKDDTGFGNAFPTIRRVNMSGNGVAKWPDTTGLQVVQDAALAGTQLNFELVVNDNGDKYAGLFTIGTFNLTGEVNGATTFNIALASSGVVTHTRT